MNPPTWAYDGDIMWDTMGDTNYIYVYYTDAANASCYKFVSSETVMVSASLGDGCVCNNGVFLDVCGLCLFIYLFNFIFFSYHND